MSATSLQTLRLHMNHVDSGDLEWLLYNNKIISSMHVLVWTIGYSVWRGDLVMILNCFKWGAV